MTAQMRTALYPLHQKLGARMTIFGGFEMPLSYLGIIEEHLAVRSAAGIFDLSHMGEFELRGPRAIALLERAFTNSAARMRENQAQYTIMCAADGGTLDDLIVYRIASDRYLLCVNASNIDSDRDWLMELNRAGARADFEDISAATALVAIQGPRAAEISARLTRDPIASLPRFGVAEFTLAGIRCLAARTGYTGEDGFEFFLDPSAAAILFEALLDCGKDLGVVPCGLGARDTLRLEAGLPLYGHELDRGISPIEARLGAFVKLKRDFIGEPVLRAQHDNGTQRQLSGLMTDDARSVARQGYRILRDGRPAGTVTSGTFAPWLKRPIAMGYLTRAAENNTSDQPGSDTGAYAVEIRNRAAAASLAKLPFYRRGDARAQA